MDHALIGGVALSAYGIIRTTIDLDILTHYEYKQTIVKFLESLGYETLSSSTAFSSHEHPLPGMGRIDFLYVSDRTAERILKEARKKTVFEDKKIKVVKPEHLIALKLYAVKCNPDRRHKEWEDIRNLLKLSRLNLEEVQEYFQKYSTPEKKKELMGDEE